MPHAQALDQNIQNSVMRVYNIFYDVLTGDVSCGREAKLEAAPRELTPNPEEVAPPVTLED